MIYFMWQIVWGVFIYKILKYIMIHVFYDVFHVELNIKIPLWCYVHREMDRSDLIVIYCVYYLMWEHVWYW